MTKVCVFMVLIIFLISSSALAANNGDYMSIKLKPGQTGEELQVSQLDWHSSMDEQIQSVNDGLGEFIVEISNDPTEWQAINWLENQPGTGVRDFHRLDMTLDGGLNTARMQNLVRLMKDKGLERLALRYIPVRSDQVFIKVYYQAYPVKETVITSSVPYQSGQTDKATQESLDRLYELIRIKAEQLKPSAWALSLGLQASAVSDGRPIITPSASLLRLKGKYMLAVTGGFWPKDNLDQKMAALWLAYFPKNPHLGLMVQASYTSEVISNVNGYIQQGYGPMLGLIFKDDKLSIHLIGGFQYFDRLEQDRRLEPAINLGVNLGVLSF